VSNKNDKVARLIAAHHGRELDPHYLGYFDCFNRGLYFEAHEVLEELWLPQRHRQAGDFYKGLIQLAGGFVHLQKHRPGPAAALLKLARQNLSKYPRVHEHLDLRRVMTLIEAWLNRIESGNPSLLALAPGDTPALALDS
jgi:predicted metal-dependent hydrolase